MASERKNSADPAKTAPSRSAGAAADTGALSVPTEAEPARTEPAQNVPVQSGQGRNASAEAAGIAAGQAQKAGPASSDSGAAAFSRHDHDECASGALARAEAAVGAAGARLTPVRRRVLEILLSGHRAFGAYDVLDQLAAEGFAKQPPVAYRALDFLVEHGLAHRIRRLNAFAACSCPGESHAPMFLICEGCKAVAETPAPQVRAEMDRAAATLGFRIERSSIEAAGLCPACAA